MTKKIIDIVYQILDDNKAQNIVIIDLKNKSSIADYMIIASGTSSRHIQAISENTAQKLKSFGCMTQKTIPETQLTIPDTQLTTPSTHDLTIPSTHLKIPDTTDKFRHQIGKSRH